MKTVSFLSILATVACLSCQHETPSHVVSQKIWVRGNCDMCKERIETQFKGVKGVQKVNWDVEHQELSIQYDSTLISQKAIETRCAQAGHETKTQKSPAKALQELPECCQPGAAH